MGRKKIPHSFVEELLSRIDIVDLVSRYLSLKQVGRNYSALCPFHPEKTPSFVVSPEKQIFKCFGCGAGGNAITFIEKYENLSFFEAVKRLCEIYGIELPKEFTDQEDDNLSEAGKAVALFFHNNLEKIKSVVEKRCSDEKLIKRFLLGYAPKGYEKDLKIDKDAKRRLGLINDRGKPLFSDRLIIPIFNHSGKIVAFAGRALKDTQQPKYINSPDSDIFHKKEILFGFYQAKEKILKNREIILVEGYFDVISLFSLGFENAVAPMGTSLTYEQAKVIKRYSDKIFLFFDGDKAGEKATVRAGRIFAELGVEPFVVRPPDGEDPDSVAQKGREYLQTLFDTAVPFSDFLIDRVKKAPVDEKIEAVKEAVESFSPIQEENIFKFKKFLNKLSVASEIDITWFKRFLKGLRKVSKQESTSLNLVPPVEKAFSAAIINGKLPSDIDLSPNIFISSECRKLFMLFKLHGAVPSFTEIESEYPELIDYITEIEFEDFSEEEMLSAVRKMVIKEIERRLRLSNSFNEKKRLKELSIKLSCLNSCSLEEIVSCIH